MKSDPLAQLSYDDLFGGEYPHVCRYSHAATRVANGIAKREGPTDYGVQSLRRTKALHILKGTGDLQTVRALLGHVKIESTARYLGIETKADPIAVCRAFDI
jgi:site-specific recombinase XerC